MSQIWAISLKELKSYFVSPIAYVVMAMFLLISGYFFTLILFYTKDAGMMRYLFGNMVVILLLISPLLSMRLFAEEQRNKTLELLLTSPVSDAGIVMGKFIASALFLLLMLVLTFYFPVFNGVCLFSDWHVDFHLDPEPNCGGRLGFCDFAAVMVYWCLQQRGRQ
jgi:ABC-2 type transport system permease protein